MQTVPLKMVTLFTDPMLEPWITRDLRHLGATGFTIVEGRGEGSRQRQSDAYPGSIVRIEAIVSGEVADRIVAHVASLVFTDYEIIATVSDVAVVRRGKFAAATARAGD